MNIRKISLITNIYLFHYYYLYYRINKKWHSLIPTEIGRLNVTGSRLKLIDIINRYHGSDSLSTIHVTGRRGESNVHYFATLDR